MRKRTHNYLSNSNNSNTAAWHCCFCSYTLQAPYRPHINHQSHSPAIYTSRASKNISVRMRNERERSDLTKRGISRELERVRCPAYDAPNDVRHILLKRSETTKWRPKLVYSKWQNRNETVTDRKVLNCINAMEI